MKTVQVAFLSGSPSSLVLAPPQARSEREVRFTIIPAFSKEAVPPDEPKVAPLNSGNRSHQCRDRCICCRRGYGDASSQSRTGRPSPAQPFPGCSRCLNQNTGFIILRSGSKLTLEWWPHAFTQENLIHRSPLCEPCTPHASDFKAGNGLTEGVFERD